MTIRQASESASISRMETELRDVVRSITNVRSELVCWRDATGQTAKELQRVSSELESISERLSAMEARSKKIESQFENQAQEIARDPQILTLYQADAATQPTLASADRQTGETKIVPSNLINDERCGWIYAKAPAHRDDLTEIWGIGPGYERRLQQSGIYTFSQIASWSDETIDHFDNLFSFKGRIRREKWVEQADRLKLAKSA
jgi:predicted flap endonuclease-1-like 5' DNA nuclease